jgi:hypothetical protein
MPAKAMRLSDSDVEVPSASTSRLGSGQPAVAWQHMTFGTFRNVIQTVFERLLSREHHCELPPGDLSWAPVPADLYFHGTGLDL